MESDSDLKGILGQLCGTHEKEILLEMDKLYTQIADSQSVWYKESGFTCPPGCGECCRNFEPDLLASEAYFMAAWLLAKEAPVAEKVADGEFPFPENKGCPFWNEKQEYHCTIYGGRPFVCRFFGAYGARSKSGEVVFKPCKFYPANLLASHKPPLAHRQYAEKELKDVFGYLPPLSTDIMESALSLNGDNKSTKLIREILPQAVRHLKWICSMAQNPENA